MPFHVLRLVLISYGRYLISDSDFPSSSYAKYSPTKRKSAKHASGSSFKLVSYSPVFASNFLDLAMTLPAVLVGFGGHTKLAVQVAS